MGTNNNGKVRGRGKPKGTKNGYTMSEKALAQRRKYSPIANQNNPLEGEDIDYNSRHIQHIMHIHEISTHADKKDPVSLRSCFINYLLLCQQDGFKVGNIAACAAMGIDKRTLCNWANSDRTEFRELAEFVRVTCAISREGMIADQKINPVIGIFWQRNFDGLRNDTEQIQQATEEAETGDELSASEYRKKYGKLIEE